MVYIAKCDFVFVQLVQYFLLSASGFNSVHIRTSGDRGVFASRDVEIGSAARLRREKMLFLVLINNDKRTINKS